MSVQRDRFEETHVELLVSRDDRLAHVSTVRHHLRIAMQSLAEGRYAAAGMWLNELEQRNEQEAVRARATSVEARPCPDCTDCVRVPGHGKAA